MKKYSVTLVVVLSLLFAAVSTHAQTFAEELRPFDFTDRYYEENGIIGFTLVGRKNGADGQSVFDTPSEVTLSNIRITATLPAYTTDGDVVFWNYYGGASRESFAQSDAGGNAVDLAFGFPMYVFPSTTVKNADRQSAMIHMSNSYFEKNHIGISAVFMVEYTDLAYTKAGKMALQLLVERNGASLDGTPIIRNARELDGLKADGLITIRQAGLDNSDRMPFAVSKVIENPEKGAITGDAFLIYVKEMDGDPLAAESHILSKFECLQNLGGKCF